MSPEEEVKMLQSENEIPVEQLRAMYASALRGNDDDDEEGAPTSEGDDGTRESPGERTPQSINATFLEDGGDDEDETDGEDFVPEAGEDVDDETTMEAEEKLGRDMSYEDEIALLNKENEISVEQLRAKYAAAFQKDDPDHDTDENNEDDEPKSSLSQLASSALVDDNSDAGDDGEFVAGADEGDDETTMEAEERLGREMSYEDEIAMLQKESETPIEDLYEMYKKIEESHNDGSEVEAMDEEEGDDVPSSSGTKRKRGPRDVGKDGKRSKNDDDTDEGLAAMQALEESAERARRTLASRPFLLAPWVNLREYQQIGLNWLVSLQTRRLNGILADGKFD
jgi:E1A-binding protein p400